MHLNSALYGKVYRKVGSISKPTGNVSRVLLIQQRIDVLRMPAPLYHVGLVVAQKDEHYIFEHGPIRYDPRREWEGSLVIPLPGVHNTIRDIQEFEHTLPDKYIVGLRDCRHHVLDLLEYLYPET